MLSTHREIYDITNGSSASRVQPNQKNTHRLYLSTHVITLSPLNLPARISNYPSNYTPPKYARYAAALPVSVWSPVNVIMEWGQAPSFTSMFDIAAVFSPCGWDRKWTKVCLTVVTFCTVILLLLSLVIIVKICARLIWPTMLHGRCGAWLVSDLNGYF